MDAVVTAGGIPTPDDPLYEYTQGLSKALVDVAGKPMVQWILDALDDAKEIENIVIVGLDAGSGVTSQKPLHFVPNQGGMIDNIRTGAEKVEEVNPAAHHVLLVSSDVPTITSQMIDWVVTEALKTDHDIYYNVVEKSVMEARFPGSKRTYTPLKGLSVCGGDVNVVKIWTITAKEGLWNKMADARKSAVKQALLFGIDTVLLLILRALDLDGFSKQVTKRLGFPCRAILCPHAEIAMDVDKPSQLELLRADLSS